MSPRARVKIFGQSLLSAIFVFFMVYPATRALGLGVSTVEIPTDDLWRDALGVFAMCVVIAMVVEAIRQMTPGFAREEDLTTGKKLALRFLAFLIGGVAGVYGYAPAIMDGSNPRFVGGLASGAAASMVGHVIAPFINKGIISLVKQAIASAKSVLKSFAKRAGSGDEPKE